MIKPNAPYRPKRLEGQRDRQQRRAPGKRSRTRTSRKQGRYITSRPARRVTDLALDATLREAAPYQRERREAATPGGAPEAEPTPSAEPAAPGALDAAALRRSWDAVLDAVNSRKRATKALLLNATVVGLTSRSLTLGFTTPGLVRTFQNGTNEDVLREALQETLGLDVAVELVVGADTPSSPSAPAPAAPAYEGLAPGDEIEPVDPDVPEPERAVLGDEAALALVQDQLGGRVLEDGRP
jgi:hypothetical protein